jgi:hypothetical protein
MIDNDMVKETRLHFGILANEVQDFRANNTALWLNGNSDPQLMTAMALCSLTVAVEKLIKTIENQR